MRYGDSIPSAALPDYDRMAADFDLFLPHVHPVTWAVLEHLPTLSEGASVLDVACGTGEPGLTLARRSPGMRLLGIDAAAGMIEVARVKAAREHLPNVHFEVMPSETLACADGSMDAVISRFGLMLFGDLPASARELARVLRAGGHFSMAVWDDMTKAALVYTMLKALRGRLPTELVPPFEGMCDLAAEAQGLLHEAGLSSVQSEMFHWTMEFPSLHVLWQLVSGPGLFTRQFAALDEESKEQMRSEVAAALATYRQDNGQYHIPHACRLLWGRR
jgi:ubiquinone/menaquinone biosynthesis C-methylase UbiE